MTIDDVFTPRQQEYLLSKDARINILMGAVRSGKTYISLYKFATRVRYSPPDAVFMFIALTSTTLVRNVLDVLMSIVGEDNLSYSTHSKDGWLFGHHILLEYAPDERAEQKIRGLTLDGAYCDELTLYPETFWSMLLSRLSKPNACVYATTNPDNPMHWLKEKYIDREEELNLKSWFFAIDDNTFLDPQYIRDLKLEYTGVFYQRFILGQWVIADGLVYSAFDRETMVIDTPSDDNIRSEYAEKFVAIDYGIQNPTAYILAGWHIQKKEWHILREWKYGGKDGVIPKTDPELYAELERFADPFNITDVIIDPSAESFAQLIHKEHKYKVRDANNEVLKGISFVNTLFHQYKLKICSCCKELLKELWSYSWDTEKSRKTGTDVVIKENDHLCLTGDTLIDTEYGKKPIKDLVGTSGNVWSFNTETQEAELKPYNNVCLTEHDAEVYEIITENGKSIKVTGNHPILTERGYIKAQYLKESDRIIYISDDLRYNVNTGGIRK